MADNETRLPVPLLDGERAQEHDDLEHALTETLADWFARNTPVCEHTQLISFRDAAEALMKDVGARIDELRDQYEQAFTALQRRTEEWQDEQAARIAAEQATIAADQRAKQAERELALAMGPTMYLPIQQILDGALGARREDGAGAGLVAEIQLLADRARRADAELEQWRANFGESALRDGLERMARLETERNESAKRVTFLTEVMAGTVLLGADDAIGMLRALTESLVKDGTLTPDQATRVYAGLDKQHTEQDRLVQLVRDLTDPCDFDHRGGCQAHGYLDLKPGEKCPQAEAKELAGTETEQAALDGGARG